MLTAISSGVSAFSSIPIGEYILSNCSLGTPKSTNADRVESHRRFDPITPMYAAGVASSPGSPGTSIGIPLVVKTMYVLGVIDMEEGKSFNANWVKLICIRVGLFVTEFWTIVRDGHSKSDPLSKVRHSFAHMAAADD